jgi:hypothetical protein
VQKDYNEQLEADITINKFADLLNEKLEKDGHPN